MTNNIISIGKNFIRLFVHNRQLIWSLTKRDFSNKYMKNYFGLAWAILDPLFFILILYFVFQYRFNTNDLLGVPFVTYLVTGYVSYELLNISLVSVTHSIRSYSFLIKKIDFHSGIIPLVKLFSNFLMHQIILIIVGIILIFSGIQPSILWFQVYYYQFALMMLLIGAGWISSSISIFFPDLDNIINIITRLMFFMTPIFWSLEGLPKNYVLIMKLNPIVYVVDGYRESLLFQTPFYVSLQYTLYYWLWVVILWILGIYTFNRLKPHFADII